MSELKRGSVYRLESVNKDRLIIKIENFRQNEGLGAFVARQEENSAMAAQVLQGVPGINRLTLADIGVLTALPANTPGGGIAGLQNALAAMGQFPMSAVKAQNVNAGTSLGKVFNPRRVQGQWTEAFAPAPYLQNLQTAQAQKQLGEMAAFDLLVSMLIGSVPMARSTWTISILRTCALPSASTMSITTQILPPTGTEGSGSPTWGRWRPTRSSQWTISVKEPG